MLIEALLKRLMTTTSHIIAECRSRLCIETTDDIKENLDSVVMEPRDGLLRESSFLSRLAIL
jgi:hypothetical protein